MDNLEILKTQLESMGFIIKKIEDIQYGQKITFENSKITLNIFEKTIQVQGKIKSDEAVKLKKILESIRGGERIIPAINKKIVDIINERRESATLDYKEMWYKSGQSSKMVHDIICMANNIHDEDAYIIIGVDDNGNVVGVDRASAKRSEEIPQALEIYKFAGGVRPDVELTTIFYMGMEVDVLIIKKTLNVPYYLEEDTGKLKAYSIYTRYNDKNTSTNGTAPYDIVKKLWEINLKR